MKILKRASWEYKFTCNGCKSELEAEPSDVRIDYPDHEENSFYVNCVVCVKAHIIKDDDVPNDIKNMAQNYFLCIWI